MDTMDTNYKLPEGYMLGCTSCQAVFKDVVSAADHSVECDDAPLPFQHLDALDTKKCLTPDKKKKYPYSVRRPRRIRTWTREYEATMLSCLRRNVEVIGHARAQKGIKHYTTVMELLTKEMQKSIGDWLTRKAVIRKWLSLLRRARDYDSLSNKYPKLGYLNLDPPEFYGTIKEIEKEIENVKLREQEKQRELSGQCEGREAEAGDGGRVTMAGEGEEVFGQPPNHEYDNIQSFKVEVDEYANSQEQKLIEVIDIGNSMIRKDILISVLNLLEQETVTPAEVAEKFDMKEEFVDLIRQKKENLMTRLERCSLCHLLLENREELVNHELQCSDKNRWLGFKYYTDRMEEKNEAEGDSFQFHPATIEELIKLVIEIKPRENRKNAWKKIAYHLTSFQKGVTVKRCSQKWRNLVNQCRTYSQLLRWAELHNYQHSRAPPEHYHTIMPFITAADLRKESQQQQQQQQQEAAPIIITSGHHQGSSDVNIDVGDLLSDDDDDVGDDDTEEGVVNECGENEDGTRGVTATDVTDHREGESKVPITQVTTFFPPATPKTPSSHPPMSPLGLAVRSINAWEETEVEEAANISGGGVSRGDTRVTLNLNPDKSPSTSASTSQTLVHQASRISSLEKKLESALAQLADLSKEHQRLSSKVTEQQQQLQQQQQQQQQQQEPRTPPRLRQAVEQMTTITEAQTQANTVFGRQLETLVEMWERQHREHISAVKQLTQYLVVKKQRTATEARQEPVELQQITRVAEGVTKRQEGSTERAQANGQRITAKQLTKQLVTVRKGKDTVAQTRPRQVQQTATDVTEEEEEGFTVRQGSPISRPQAERQQSTNKRLKQTLEETEQAVTPRRETQQRRKRLQPATEGKQPATETGERPTKRQQKCIKMEEVDTETEQLTEEGERITKEQTATQRRQQAPKDAQEIEIKHIGVKQVAGHLTVIKKQNVEDYMNEDIKHTSTVTKQTVTEMRQTASDAKPRARVTKQTAVVTRQTARGTKRTSSDTKRVVIVTTQAATPSKLGATDAKHTATDGHQGSTQVKAALLEKQNLVREKQETAKVKQETTREQWETAREKQETVKVKQETANERQETAGEVEQGSTADTEEFNSELEQMAKEIEQMVKEIREEKATAKEEITVDSNQTDGARRERQSMEGQQEVSETVNRTKGGKQKTDNERTDTNPIKRESEQIDEEMEQSDKSQTMTEMEESSTTNMQKTDAKQETNTDVHPQKAVANAQPHSDTRTEEQMVTEADQETQRQRITEQTEEILTTDVQQVTKQADDTTSTNMQRTPTDDYQTVTDTQQTSDGDNVKQSSPPVNRTTEELRGDEERLKSSDVREIQPSDNCMEGVTSASLSTGKSQSSEKQQVEYSDVSKLSEGNLEETTNPEPSSMSVSPASKEHDIVEAKNSESGAKESPKTSEQQLETTKCESCSIMMSAPVRQHQQKETNNSEPCDTKPFADTSDNENCGEEETEETLISERKVGIPLKSVGGDSEMAEETVVQSSETDRETEKVLETKENIKTPVQPESKDSEVMEDNEIKSTLDREDSVGQGNETAKKTPLLSPDTDTTENAPVTRRRVRTSAKRKTEQKEVVTESSATKRKRTALDVKSPAR